jgi:purine/pyrimidine-nucleoside phosphorylase
MFKTNEYFEGNVKSLSFQTADGPATIGVMAKGEYEFGTSTIEVMTVTSGELTVQLPDASEWTAFKPYESFMVEKGVKFKVKADSDTTYLCLYL